MTDPAPLAFRWRRELPWLLAPLALGLLVRLPAVLWAEAVFNSDTAVWGLMAKHMATGARWPLYYYGQSYVGHLDALLAAPWYGLLGADPRGLAASQLLVYAGVSAVVYRIGWMVGRRPGALAGGLLLALGSPALLGTGAELPGYLSTQLLGGLLLLAGLDTLRRPGLARAGVLGLLAGYALYNQPLAAQFVGALAVGAWSRGSLVGALAGRRLGVALGSRRRARWVVLALLGLGVYGVLSLGLGVAGVTRLSVLGLNISMERPFNYVTRAGALLVSLLGLLELILAPRRGRLIAGLGMFGAGAALGGLAVVLDRLVGLGMGPPPPMGLDLTAVSDNLAPLRALLARAFAGPGGAPGWIGALWFGLLGATALGWLIGLARRRALSDADVLGLMLAVQTAILLGVALIRREPQQDRYLLPLWLPMCALTAALVGGLARRHLAPGLLALAVGATVHAAGSWAHLRAVPQRQVPDRAVIESLRARGLTAGLGTYWAAYRLLYLSDETLRIGSYDVIDRLPWETVAARATPRRFLVIYEANGQPGRYGRTWYLEDPLEHTVERYRIGPYEVFVTEYTRD